MAPYPSGHPTTMNNLHPVLTTFSRNLTEQILKDHPTKTPSEIHHDIEEARNNLTKEDVRYFSLAYDALEHLSKSESIERAVWMYHNERLDEAKETDLEGNNNRDIYFFKRVLRMWNAETKLKQRRYKKQAAHNERTHAAPLMPNTLELHHLLRSGPTADNGLSSSSSDEIDLSTRLKDVGNIDSRTIENNLNNKIRLLNLLVSIMERSCTTEHASRISNIKAILAQKDCPSLKVAVVGASGAGKSSVINALLGEKLMPSSSSKACTPFPIEITHLNAGDNSHQVRLTICYLEKESLSSEIERFFITYQNAGDVTVDSLARVDADFKITWDRIKILLPDITEKGISQMCPDDILEHSSLVNYLGQSHTVSFSQPKDAYNAINQLIKGRSTADLGGGKTKLPPLWPLVKYVGVEIQNEVLKHGITIIDVPGTEDTNKARASVAEKQLKTCSTVWVVAHIIRATDSANANDLLEKAIEQKLHLDMMPLTFIGTKSDDIGCPQDEAEEYGVEDEIDALNFEADKLEVCIENCLSELEKLKLQIEAGEKAMQIPKLAMETHENLKRGIEAGNAQQRPFFYYVGQKRKRAASTSLEDSTPNVDLEADAELNQNAVLETVSQLDEYMDIKTLHADFEQRSASLEGLAREEFACRQTLENFQKQLAAIPCKKRQVCIQARNRSNVLAIRKSYADMLRRFQAGKSISRNDKSQGIILDEDEIKDLAEGLSIHMVSARAHGHLFETHGQDGYSNLHKDKEGLTSFLNEEQTGIPSLRVHIVDQAKSAWRAHAIKLTNRITTLENGMYLAGSKQTFNLNVTAEMLEEKRHDVIDEMQELKEVLDSIINKADVKFRKELQSRILDKLPEACRIAEEQAESVTQAFSNSIKSLQTFKALFSRMGAFTSSSGIKFDFNADLERAITNTIGPNWRVLFATKLPEINKRQYVQLCSAMARVEKIFVAWARRLGCSPKIVELVQEQHERYLRAIEDACDEFQQNVQFEQRDARRTIYNSIQLNLVTCYEDLEKIKGKGGLKIVRAEMIAKVKAKNGTLFTNATNALHVSLNRIAMENFANLKKTIFKDVLPAMQNDYCNIFKLADIKIDPEELDIQCEIIKILEEDLQKDASTQMIDTKNEPMNTPELQRGLFMEE